MAVRKIFVAFTVIGILVGAGALTFILIKTKPESKKSPAKMTVLGVKTDYAQYADYSIEIEYPGRVVARDIVTLIAEASGKIMSGSVPLKVGERFRKGDVLLRINSDDVRAAYKAQISEFLTVLSNSLPDIKIDFPEEYDKWYNFFTDVDMDKKLPKLPMISSVKEKVYLSSKNILAVYYGLIEREINLTHYVIRAPFDGTYYSVNKEVGSVASLNSEVGRIISTDVLELVVGVALEDAQILSKGIELDIVSSGGIVHKGIVDRIAPYVDQTTQKVNVYVVFKEPNLEIIEGQLLSVTMPSKTLNNVIKLNRDAIVGDTLIYCVNDYKLHSHRVELVAKTALNVYVRGVDEGSCFVGESLVAPYEEMPVKLLDMNGQLREPVQIAERVKKP